MRSPVGRMLVKGTQRETDGRLMEVLRRIELALGEVKVIERREKGVVTDRAVVNKDALVRARKAYLRATEFVAAVRIEEGTATGRVRGDRKPVADACTRLTHLEKKLVELERL
jgi:hypothetical protein